MKISNQDLSSQKFWRKEHFPLYSWRISHWLSFQLYSSSVSFTIPFVTFTSAYAEPEIVVLPFFLCVLVPSQGCRTFILLLSWQSLSICSFFVFPCFLISKLCGNKSFPHELQRDFCYLCVVWHCRYQFQNQTHSVFGENVSQLTEQESGPAAK